MKVSKSEFSQLEKFQRELDGYFAKAMGVYRMVNHHDYVSDEEAAKRGKSEQDARRAINISFGRIEQLIYNLLGGKPMMQIPAIPGYQWDVFAEAFSSNFRTSAKGDCLEMAKDAIDRAVGRAAGLITEEKEEEKMPPKPGERMFDEQFVKKINQDKIRELCKEFNNVYATNPNAGALLFRTILLITLQHKLGSKAKEDLTDVLNQAISQNLYNDKHIDRILKNLQGIPKTLQDATYHSQWILINASDLQTWAQGLKQILLATFK